MNYRKYELLAAESIATAATKPIDLKGLSPISRLNVQTLQTQDDADLKVGHIAKIVTKIQIVDGSNVLFEANGLCAQAQDIYQGRKTQLNHFYDEWEGQSRCNFTINFGRMLYDEVLAFDPSKFKNPQLKISHNHALAGANGATAHTLRVEVDIFDEKMPSLLGFLQFKEVFSKAIVASNSEYLDLPLDYPIRSLMLQSLEPSKNPVHLFESIKLTEDNGRRVILEDNMFELIQSLPTFQPYTEMQRAVTAVGLVNLPCTPTWQVQAHATGRAAYEDYYCTPNDGGYCQVGAVAGGIDALILFRGYCPHGAISIPFGKAQVIEDWYDVTKLEKLQLKLTAGQYTAAGQDQVVLVEQLRSY